MTRLSHDRLEQSVISKPVTLRDSLLELRHVLAQSDGALQGEAANRLLHLAAYHGAFEQAALYSVADDVIDPVPRATIGPEFTLHGDDILITRCLEKRRTSYWASNSLKAGEQSAYLVAASLHTSDGTLLGMLVVAAMPFLFLNEDTLLAVSVLLAYFADDAIALKTAGGVVQNIPTCPPRFAAEIVKLQRAKRDLNLASTLAVVFMAAHPLRDKALADIATLSRGLDETWQTQVGDVTALVTLMPFSNSKVAEGYIYRVENRLKERFGMPIGANGASSRILEIGTQDVTETLRQLLDRNYAA